MDLVGGNETEEFGAGFDVFKKRANYLRDNNIVDPTWLSGFEKRSREGIEELVVDNIFFNIFNLMSELKVKDSFFLDIGSGASKLTDLITKYCVKSKLHHVLNDSEEVLNFAEVSENRTFIKGNFLDNIQIFKRFKPNLRVILGYSVLQYIFADNSQKIFFEKIIEIMNDECILYLGDIPNYDMRNRARIKAGLKIEHDPLRLIGDQELIEIYDFFSKKGYNVFMLPQSRELPLSNHRIDILIGKPRSY
jgi:hypothetical protein